MTSAAEPKQVPEGRGTFRFSGHQTFPLRIAWLPKAIQEISRGNDPLSDVDTGITSLGLGKNMVEALRCWIEAFQVARRAPSGWCLTEIADKLFAPGTGHDPYLEDVASCWMLHWLICTNRYAPFFAWECLFNRWTSPEFSASQVLHAFRQESNNSAAPASDVTLKQHWEVFIHSYRPPRNQRGEDHLDSALSLLGMVGEAGERQSSAGKWEIVYTFDTGPRAGISQDLFAYFLHDWWDENFPDEQTVQLRDIISGPYSPGRLLKMHEVEVVHRLEDFARQRSSDFLFVESMNMRRIQRNRPATYNHYIECAFAHPRFI